MQDSSRPSTRERPENLVDRLATRLNRHVLWDSLLVVVPPAAVIIYIIAVLFRSAWLSQTATVTMTILVLVLGALVVVLRRRPLTPSIRGAACLVDQRAGAKDHFLTLTTIDSKKEPVFLLTRLRQQAEGFLQRVELKRDFPYRFKGSAYWSLALSLLAAILVYALVPIAHSARYAVNAPERLREIAQQMTAQPNLRPLAKELETLAAKLDDPNITPEEKQALAQKMEQRLEEEKKKEEQKDNRDLLADASGALSGVEKQQQVTGGQEPQKEQQKGAGGIQSNTPQDGEGENKQSQGGAGESKGNTTAQASQEKMDQGKSAQPDAKEQSQAGDTKNDRSQPDPNQKDPNKEKAAKSEGGSKDGAGKQQASAEPPPQGGPQADRFYKPGEGKEGLAGKGYVTVQLPEDVIADSKGESRATKESKNNRARTQVPVSNVPLPAHVPNAPTEKQQMPIEYRGIIR
jgi:hypothetical protein